MSEQADPVASMPFCKHSVGPPDSRGATTTSFTLLRLVECLHCCPAGAILHMRHNAPGLGVAMCVARLAGYGLQDSC